MTFLKITLLIIEFVIALVIIKRLLACGVKAYRRYKKTHWCFICHSRYSSDNWYQEYEICGNYFCNDNVGRREDIIDTIDGVLGETIRLLDTRKRGFEPRGWTKVCGYEHIITMHKVNSVSLFYCASHKPGNLDPVI